MTVLLHDLKGRKRAPSM